MNDLLYSRVHAALSRKLYSGERSAKLSRLLLDLWHECLAAKAEDVWDRAMADVRSQVRERDQGNAAARKTH